MLGIIDQPETIQVETAPSLFSGAIPIHLALAELRLRLLDLTGRNRLINFRHSPGKSLQFVHTNIDAAFKRLVDQNNRVIITPLPEPDRSEWVLKNGRLAKAEPREWAASLGIDPSYNIAAGVRRPEGPAITGSDARTLFYAEDLGKHCRKLEREAKLAIEETGANMLYLVMGFMEFPEAPDSEKLYQAPLLCVPVSIVKEDQGRYSTFYLNFTGEELIDNLSLREKLKRDFAFNLPEYDPESEVPVDEYLEEVSEAIRKQPNWSVKRMMTLTLLSFTNMLLVRELQPESWPKDVSLEQHPLIRQVFEGGVSEGSARYAPEYPIDEHPGGNLPLIYDADSSQHSALIDVLNGHNRVIEGPPGTGKSQTITNLIAAALHSGKKILFVAEKLAALEVVKSRLTQAGLDSFVLELHSNKANKKRVLEDISERIKMRTPSDGGLDDMLERLAQKRQELKAYADLMNTRIGNNLGLTLHQVMWRTERHRLCAGDSALAARQLEFLAASRTEKLELDDICDRLRYLARQLTLVESYSAAHPLWGFFPSELRPEDDVAIQRVLRDFEIHFERFANATSGAAMLLGGDKINMGADSAKRLIDVLVNIGPDESNEVDYTVLPKVFSENDPGGSRSKTTLDDIERRIEAIHGLEVRMQSMLLDPQPASNALCDEAHKSLDELKTLGFIDSTEVVARTASLSLARVVNHARAALEVLSGVAQTIGLSFSGQASEVQHIAAVARVCSTSTKEVLDYRHEGLRQPGAVVLLEKALAEVRRLQSEAVALDALLYMDALPNESELAVAIQTLREGDTWYRFFQGRWRAAINLHRRISKNKDKKPAILRLEELEKLSKWSKDRTAFESDATARKLAGSYFNGEKTPLKELINSARWIDSSSQVMVDSGLKESVFDLLTVERLTVARLSQQLPAVSQAISALNALDAEAELQLRGALANVHKNLDSPSWPIRIDTTEAAATSLSVAAVFMQAHFKTSATANSGLEVIVDSAELPRLESELLSHAAGIALLEHRFQGRHTELDPIFAAHTYGLLIKKANLPERIERVLIAENCVGNHSELVGFTQIINQGWQDILEFIQSMRKFGIFESSIWVSLEGLSTSEYAKQLYEKTRLAADCLSGLLPWAQYVGARAKAMSQGLEGFVLGLESGSIEGDKLEHVFNYRFYAGIAKAIFDRTPQLKRFSGERHSSIRSEFAALDRNIIKLRGLQVARECKRLARPPQGYNGARVGEKTEMHLIELLINQQRPRVPVRQIMKRAGKAVQELKPCFMMGPQAVAQFLEPGHLKFDIVVMDEASQLRPEQAIGAVARGAQLVVVGDPKQLPPTSFFSRMSTTDDDPDGLGQMATTEAESILDVCISHFQPVRTLRWHYRSRHESLIAFSNHHFYRGNLVVFPSPYPKSKALGLSYHYVSDGLYESQMNHVEAHRVVDAAVEHIVTRPNDSLGIVTLNIKQRDLVAELLEERLRNLPQAVSFKEKWEAEGMGLFVKNLENVQGDERDCILISTTFGKAKDTDVVRQNFGPISRMGGWRRLNVLFTRSRKSVAVYSSMRPEDIVSDNRTPEGTKALRNYLEFARDGVLRSDEETGLPPDSDFEVAVMDVLRGKGYEVVAQLGVAGFRIDIAVKHPTNRSGYLAAIECDGASYHSGVSVRDRDRIRQEILESLGWKGRIWRIWSTDWFRNPLAELDKLLQFLKSLESEPLPAEYMSCSEEAGDYDIVETESAIVTKASDSLAADVQLTTELVLDEDEEDLEIGVGDLITYFPAGEPNNEMQVKLTNAQTDIQMGLVGQNTPLGSVLLGATVGEEVVLRVPGISARSFVIKSIKRLAD